MSEDNADAAAAAGTKRVRPGKAVGGHGGAVAGAKPRPRAPLIEVQKPMIREPSVFDSFFEYASRFYEVSIKGSKATLKEVEKLGLKEKLTMASRAAGKVSICCFASVACYFGSCRRSYHYS